MCCVYVVETDVWMDSAIGKTIFLLSNNARRGKNGASPNKQIMAFKIYKIFEKNKPKVSYNKLTWQPW